MNNKAEEIARNIRDILNEIEWTQLRLAREAQITPSHINKIMHGKVVPRASTLQIIADTLGVPVRRIVSDKPDLTLATRLRKAREQKGLNQIELAEQVGVHPTTITNYEIAASMPTGIILKCMCEVLGVSADWLLGLKENDS